MNGASALLEILMKKTGRIIAVALVVTGTAVAGTVLLAAPIAAQSTPGAPQFRPHDHLLGRHIEGRLAFLRTELKISDAQAPAWDHVAQILRDRAATMDGMMGDLRTAK